MIRKSITIFIAAILSAWALFRMDGFSSDYLFVTKASKPYHFHTSLPEELQDIVSQKFSYLASGRQSFAFVSEDGKWVLKILNQSRFDLPEILRKMPMPRWLKEKRKRRKARVSNFFASYKLASQKLKEECALIYAHFDDSFFPSVILKDPIGYKHQIDLSHCWFVIQKKLDPIKSTLLEAEKDPIRWKKRVSSFFDLISARCLKGIVDDDLNVEGNIGYLDDTAYLLDPGRLFLDQKVKEGDEKKREIKKSSKHLRRFIKRCQKSFLPLFEEELGKRIPN